MREATNQEGYHVEFFDHGKGWVCSTVNEEGKIYTKEEAEENLKYCLENCALPPSQYRVYPKLK